SVVGVGEAGVPPDDQHRGESDVPVSEIALESLALLQVVEHRVPVDDLREAVFESGTPRPRRAGSGRLEDALRSAILELDNTELTVSLVAEDEVRGVIP